METIVISITEQRLTVIIIKTYALIKGVCDYNVCENDTNVFIKSVFFTSPCLFTVKGVQHLSE